MSEHIQHAGVKGMKWGSRKEKNAAIRSARFRQESRQSELSALAQKSVTEKTAKGRAQIQKSMERIANDFYNSGDAQIATKATTGEKWAAAILATTAVAFVAGAVASKI